MPRFFVAVVCITLGALVPVIASGARDYFPRPHAHCRRGYARRIGLFHHRHRAECVRRRTRSPQGPSSPIVSLAQGTLAPSLAQPIPAPSDPPAATTAPVTVTVTTTGPEVTTVPTVPTVTTPVATAPDPPPPVQTDTTPTDTIPDPPAPPPIVVPPVAAGLPIVGWDGGYGGLWSSPDGAPPSPLAVPAGSRVELGADAVDASGVLFLGSLAFTVAGPGFYTEYDQAYGLNPDASQDCSRVLNFSGQAVGDCLLTFGVGDFTVGLEYTGSLGDVVVGPSTVVDAR